MYRSSDSLLTRISLILSILKSSPSMSSMVVVESAMETISSSANGTRAALDSRRPQMGAEGREGPHSYHGTPLQTPGQQNHYAHALSSLLDTLWVLQEDTAQQAHGRSPA